jgi:molecular chaperone GrpE
MNVIPEWDDGQLETAVVNLDARDSEAATEAVGEPGPLEVPAHAGGTAEAGWTDEQMAVIAASVRELAEASQAYHARAQQREEVIDHLHAEVDRLRRGERRALLRPLLAELCRLRNDLLRQAAELPADFDAGRAALLLRSYAESMELALDNSGVVSFAPGSGDAFDPRMHRRVGTEPAAEPALAGRIARVRRDGYLDVDANSPVALAEVVVFAAATGPQSRQDSPDKREEQ